MANADQVKLAYIEEDEFGVTPTGKLTNLRFTGESLAQQTDTASSAEIRDDRQVSDVIRTSLSASGDINTEVSYGTHDDLFAAALMAAEWSAEEEVSASTIDADDSDNSLNDSGSGFGSFNAGQWIKVSGFTTAANNGYFKIASATAAKLVLSGGTLTTEAAGESVTVTQGGQIVNGTTSRWFTLEKEYTDLTDAFAILLGQMVSGFNLSVTTNAIMTGGFSFMGKSEESASATVGDGSNTPAPSTPVMNAVDDVAGVLEDLSDIGVTSTTITLDNNLRNRSQVAELGPISIGSGKVNVTGTLQAYFSSAGLIDKYLNFDSSSLALTIEDGEGNGYVIDMPSVKYTAGPRNATGENTDVMADLTFTAFRNAAEDVTIRIARFPAS